MANLHQQPPPDKEGLEKALEFTKFLIGLSGAFIAFLTGTTFLGSINSTVDRLTVTATIILFAVSSASGLMVWARGCTMMSQKAYDLMDRHIAIPGIVNVVAFGVAAVMLGILAGYKLVWEPGGEESTAATTCSFAVFCVGL